MNSGHLGSQLPGKRRKGALYLWDRLQFWDPRIWERGIKL